jgi:hypothetical protein
MKNTEKFLFPSKKIQIIVSRKVRRRKNVFIYFPKINIKYYIFVAGVDCGRDCF